MEKVIHVREYIPWLRKQAQLKRPYWYGCYYNPCSEALLQRKAKQYPKHYTASRMPTYRKHIAAGQIAGDCVNGAIKGAIWSELGTRQPVYASHGCPDVSADGMFDYCKKQGMAWGSIASMPDKPGVAVRFSGHVGVYVGGGEVVEWRGFAYGCVVTKLSGRKWTHWYELPWVIYDEAVISPDNVEGVPSVGELGSRLLKRGSKGEDVRILQQLLMQIGYSLPKYGADGDFGAETETAVKEMQAAGGIAADGKYGEDSHRVLMGIVAEQAAQDDDEQDDEPTEGERRWVLVTGGTVNVRKGAGKSYEMVTVVTKGTRLELVATAANGWHSVLLSDGRSVWIGPLFSEVVAA